MMSRRILLWVLLGFLAVATPVSLSHLGSYDDPVVEVADHLPPPPECGLYDICNSPAS